MKFPTLDRYNEAVQSPKNAFFDPSLKNSEVERTGLGLPRALGGGFAITYSVRSAGQRIAVRCFHKSAAHIEARYQTIATVLRQTPLPCFVAFEFQKKGVKVDGLTLPIVRMEWVEGQTLGSYLENVFDDKTSIMRLLSQFRDLERLLRSRGIAHGDLQNGNVIVEPSGKLRLVDYDGMYVPGITGNSGELGHRHFQHPRRSNKTFGPNMDRFSFIVVDLSLRALAAKPALFKTYSNGDNIIFTGADFENPNASLVFSQLKTIAELRENSEALTSICGAAAEQVPSLEDFLAGIGIPAPLPQPVTRSSSPAASPSSTVHTPTAIPYVGPYPVVDAADFQEVQKHVGGMIEVVGKIVEVHSALTRHGKPFVFINFGDWRSQIVKGVLWSNALDKLIAKPDTSWKGRWISVIGMPTTYRRSKNKPLHVDIEILDGSRFRLIDEAEAQRRLGRTQSVSASPKVTNPPTSVRSNSSVLKKFGISANQQQPAAQTTPRAGTASPTKSPKWAWWLVGIAAILVFMAVRNPSQAPPPKQTHPTSYPKPYSPPSNPNVGQPAPNPDSRLAMETIRSYEEVERAREQERLRQIAENERLRKQAEENAERIRQQWELAEEAIRRKQEEQAISRELVWVVTNNYWDPIEIAYFSQQRSQEWRGGQPDRKGNHVPKGATRQHSIACEPGEIVCYGAWLWRIPGNSTVWGVGRIGARKCVDCCQICGAGPVHVDIKP